MSLKNTILKNTAWLSGGQVINNIIGYILIVAIARNLGDVGLGQYSFIFAFASFFFIIANTGTAPFMVKEVSRDNKKAQFYFENILGIRIIFGFVALFILFIATFFINKNHEVIISLWLVGLISLFDVSSKFFANFFNAFNKMQYGIISSIIERFSGLIIGLFTLILTKSLFYFVIALTISNFLRFLYLILSIRKKVKIRIRYDLKRWKDILKKSFPYFMIGIFMFIFYRFDVIMLSLIKGDEVTGWYSSAYKLINILNMIPGLLMAAIFPSMSRLYKENKKLLKQLLQRTFRYLLMIIFPISIGTFILAERFIFFVYGKSFIGGTFSLQILIWAEIFMFLNMLFMTLLNSIDKQNIVVKIAIFSALLNVLINSIAIPLYSYIGAAFATVFSMFINFILLKHFIKKDFIKIKITFSIFKALISAMIMGVIVYQLQFLAIWYVVPIGGIVYLLSLMILGLEKEDKALIIQIFNVIKRKIR